MKFDKLVESVLNQGSTDLRSIGDDIANKINNYLNIRYDSEEGKNLLVEFFSCYRVMSKRWTRDSDKRQHLDPLFVVGFKPKSFVGFWHEEVYSKEAQEYLKKKYKTDLNTIKQKALEAVKSLGEVVELSDPIRPLKSLSVKYRGIYILLDDPLHFGLVTRNKLKGLLHKTN